MERHGIRNKGSKARRAVSCLSEVRDKMITESELKAGVIFGDSESQEYVYMPGSEIGVAHPMLVYENNGNRADISLKEALRLIRVRALKQTQHPRLGQSSC